MALVLTHRFDELPNDECPSCPNCIFGAIKADKLTFYTMFLNKLCLLIKIVYCTTKLNEMNLQFAGHHDTVNRTKFQKDAYG